MSIPIPKCLKCNTNMILKEKDDSKFWGCPNWQRCQGKTQRYEGVDKPQPEKFVITAEMWNEMLLRLDCIVDILQNPVKKEIPKKIPSAEFQRVGDLIPKDEVDVKEIPF